MSFWLKKVIGQALMPVPIFIALFFIGLLLISFTKRRKLALSCLWLSFSLLFFSFLPTVGAGLVHQIEDGYEKSILTAEEDVKFISVLGHGHVDADGLSANASLSAGAVKRLVEGLRLAHLFPEAKVVLTGWKGRSSKSHEALMYEAALGLGFPKERLICFSNCRDTATEAEHIKELAGEAKVALVSEASHLRRASYLFEEKGLDVLCSAADRKGLVLDGGRYIFNSRSLRRTERAWYEFLGNIWVRLRS